MLPDRLIFLLKSSKARKFFIYGIGQAVNLVSPLLIIPYVMHIVGEKGLGKVGVGMSMAYILIVLVDYSSYIKSVKEISINREDRSKLREILTTVYFSKTLLTLAVILLVGLLCVVVPYFSADKPLIFLSLSIVVGQYINPAWFLQGTEEFGLISMVNIASKVIYLAGVFLMVKTPADYIYVNLWLGMGFVIPGIAVVFWLMRRYEARLSDFSFPKTLALIKRDFSFCLSQLLFSLRQYSPIMIIAFFAGDVVAGQYKIIEQIIMLFRTYFQMIFRFSFSIISYEIHHDYPKGMASWKRINGYSLLFVAVLLTGIYFNADFVFRFFKVTPAFLPLYRALLGVSIVIPLLIGITQAQEQLMFSFDLNRQYIKITIFITFFSLALLTVLLNLYGLMGGFAALLASETLLALLYNRFLKPHYHFARI